MAGRSPGARGRGRAGRRRAQALQQGRVDEGGVVEDGKAGLAIEDSVGDSHLDRLERDLAASRIALCDDRMDGLADNRDQRLELAVPLAPLLELVSVLLVDAQSDDEQHLAARELEGEAFALTDNRDLLARLEQVGERFEVVVA